MSNRFKELSDEEYSKLRRNLLKEKGSVAQLEFLKAVLHDADFLNYFEEKVATVGSVDVCLCSQKLTESEFKHAPADTEASLYDAWKELSPRTACRTTFWAMVTINHIKNEKIHSSYLAADGRGGTEGSNRINRLLRNEQQGVAKSKEIDDCIRAVFRRLGGLPDARGNKSIYVDCPFGRAWWRERLVSQISKGDINRIQRVRDLTRLSNAYWEELVVLVVSRNSILGSHKIREAFILSLAEQLSEDTTSPLATAKKLRTTCRVLGSIQASRELSILEDSELREVTDGVVKSQHDFWSKQ